MFRTNNRPLPKNKISIFESFFFSIFILILGSILLLYYTNFLTFYLSLLSLFLYTFIYTPLKRFSPFSVLVGALPGALPPLIG
jgi:protoheme IX farnesyltransferase